MNRSAFRVAVVALLGVVALAAAAATLTSPTIEGVPGSGGANGSVILPLPQPGETGGLDVSIPPIVQSILLVLAAVVLVVTLVWAIRNFRDALSTVLMVLAVIGIVIAVLLLLQGLLSGLQGAQQQQPPGAGGSGGVFLPGEPGSEDPFAVPIILAILGLVLLAAVVVFVGATGDFDEGGVDDPASPGGEVAEVGEAAGRAADRIQESDQEAPVDNEVYRAWREMTHLLALDRRETRTPGEFATAAIAAGMAERDVRELTSLFEDVRYGKLPPAAEGREERAVTVLRRIEETYAGPEDA